MQQLQELRQLTHQEKKQNRFDRKNICDICQNIWTISKL